MNDQYTIFPLGDCAATIELGKGMNADLNKKALAMKNWFEEKNYDGIRDSIVAYNSLTLYYDPVTIKKNRTQDTAFARISTIMQEAYEQSFAADDAGILHYIPVCYAEDFGVDLAEISRLTNLSSAEIIELHTSRVYRVYMLGFLPGFAYMGELDPALHLPRKQSPENVVAGSVGLASNQTGIYPLDSPGGWHVIGRTPVKMFNPKDKVPVKFKAGDHVQFYQVTREELEGFEV